MDIHNNEIYKYKKNNEDSSKPLNNDEINKLKNYFTLHSPTSCPCVNLYSRKNYDLFVNGKIFEPNTDNTDDLYYLGVYYRDVEKNYDLMKKYYFMATEKGNFYAMNNLGLYYENTEVNYDLMKKYYLLAIEKKCAVAMYNLGEYYQCVEINYDLMKKYFLMGIIKGHYCSMRGLYSYYIYNEPNYRDLQNYFNAIIKGNFIITETIFNRDKYIIKYGAINIYCSNIDNIINNKNINNKDINHYINNNIGNFRFCLSKIVDHINSRILYKSCESCELKNINHFINYINKLRYHSKNKQEYKKCTNEIFEKCVSQTFMEYLDLYYYEYLKKIFAPGGKGYIKTKNHFESITKQTT
jgi:hypothetical protein